MEFEKDEILVILVAVLHGFFILCYYRFPVREEHIVYDISAAAGETTALLEKIHAFLRSHGAALSY